jgi:hypothetical protein
MAKKNSIDLADYTEEEINRVLAMKTKDRNELEVRIYKKKKLVDWQARGGGKKPKTPKPVTTIDTMDEMIARNTSDEEEETEEKETEEETTEEAPRRKKYIGPTKASNWMNVPGEDQMKKEELLGHQALVLHENRNLLCRIAGDEFEVFAIDTKDTGLQFALTWEQAYITVNFATVLRVPLRAKEEAVAVAKVG